MMPLLTWLAAFVATPAPATAPAPAATFAPTRFTVEVTGRGPDVVLIPGLATPRDVWAPTAARLAKTRRVHAIQLRGFGDAPGVNASGPVYAPFVTELARYAAALDRPTLIGHSMGGLAALDIAARHSEARLAGVVVVDALPWVGPILHLSSLDEARRLAALVTARAPGSVAPPAPGPDCAATGPGLAYAVQSITTGGQCRVAAWVARADAPLAARLMAEVLTTDLRGELARVGTPVSVIHAGDAGPIPPTTIDRMWADAYAALPGARVVPVRDARHFMMLDQPDAFARALDAALAR